MRKADWLWDEMQQVGTDYASLAEVEAYDKRMGTFRDVATENREMLAMLDLPAGSAVLEIGCGTGCFARAAALVEYNVTAVDVSAMMLEFVRKRVAEQESPEIITQNAGFLTLDFAAESFDAVVSGVALHHLPDAWKLVALRNVARLLKPHGQFILRDVVFALGEGESPESCFERFVSGFKEMRVEAARHAAQEYSTYDWIMEGLLTRAGFTIKSSENPGGSFAVYHCVKA